MKDTNQFQPAKPCFLDICMNYGIDYQMLQATANRAGVSYSLIYDMFIGNPVARIDAEKILLQLSQYAGQPLTLDTVDVPVLIPETKEQPKSEVACLLAEIQQEYDSACLGLSGLAQGVSQHAFITSKMERMGQLQYELETIVGEESAIAMIAEQLEACPDTERSLAQ